MSVTGPNTGFKIVNADGGSYTQDLGQRYVSKDYLIDVYPSIAPNFGITAPGLWVWGGNAYGQLGLGDRTNRSSPVQVGALTNWKQITFSNSLFTCAAALKTDGTLWAWGLNDYGQLGLGDRNSRSSPVQVGSLTNWKQINPGYAHFLALKTDGTLWTWGRNSSSYGSGQLGLNDLVHRSSPVQVGSLNNWKLVSGGAYTSGAIKTDGTLWMWGGNNGGQLGLGNTVDRSSPVQVGTLTNWKQVSVGTNCGAIKTDGTLWAWGFNSGYYLGDGTNISRSSPVQIGSLTNWKQLSVSQASAAIKTDGTLWAWGQNNNGQLGLGDVTTRSTPVQVGTLNNWKQIFASGYLTAAIKTDGTLWTWGSSQRGEIGDATTRRSSPVQIGSLTNWKKLTDSGIFIAGAISDANY